MPEVAAFSRKSTHLFICLLVYYDIQGTLISSKPSIIELDQFVNLIEKLILCKGEKGVGGKRGGG